MPVSPLKKAVFIIVLAVFTSSRTASAAVFYTEVGGSLSSIRNGAPLFGPTTPSSPSFSVGYEAGIFHSFSTKAVTQIQFGFLDKLSNASNSGHSFSLMALYPTLRIQMSKLYVSGGLTPLVWSYSGPSPSLTGFSSASGSLAYFGEVGLLWAITPKFSMGISADMQYVTTHGTLGPAPVLDGNAFMRFYWGFSKGGESSSGEFRGWRYPFGNEIY